MSEQRDLFTTGSWLLADSVVFDLETTGLSPSDDEIIQIAAVRIRDGRVTPRDRFFSYVKPRRRIDSYITYLTGITNDHVRGAPRAFDILRQFTCFCGNSLLIGHNARAFDVPFLRSACSKRRAVLRDLQYVDSMHLSWLLWGREQGVSHSLDEVVSRLRVRRQGARRHDARGDVKLLAECVLMLTERLDRSGRGRLPKVYTIGLPMGTADRPTAPNMAINPTVSGVTPVANGGNRRAVRPARSGRR